jgi:hypothetical protein
MDEQPKRGLYGQRPSNGADAARREQIARKSPRERALSAGEALESTLRGLGTTAPRLRPG